MPDISNNGMSLGISMRAIVAFESLERMHQPVIESGRFSRAESRFHLLLIRMQVEFIFSSIERVLH